MLEDARNSFEVERELEDAWTHVHELTKALTGLTCSGSEFFLCRHGRYVADIPACLEYINRQREVAHDRAKRLVKIEREASALRSQRDHECARGNRFYHFLVANPDVRRLYIEQEGAADWADKDAAEVQVEALRTSLEELIDAIERPNSDEWLDGVQAKVNAGRASLERGS